MRYWKYIKEFIYHWFCRGVNYFWVPEKVWVASPTTVSLFDWDKRMFVGWVMNRNDYKVGHELRCKMESGKIGRFRIEEINLPLDPKDMIFITVSDVGYL